MLIKSIVIEFFTYIYQLNMLEHVVQRGIIIHPEFINCEFRDMNI